MGKQTWLTQSELKRLKSLCGSTISEMKSEINRHPDVIRRWCRDHGIKITPSKTGKKSGIFAEDVAKIMELRSSGLSFRDISGCLEGAGEIGFDTSPSNLMVIISRAKKQGMSTYQKRNDA